MKTGPKNILFLTFSLYLILLVRNQDCYSSLFQSITNINLSDPSKIDYSNPALTSGTNINDLGNFDGCVKNLNQTYILINFPLPITRDNRTIAVPIFMGICVPKQCEKEEVYDNIKNFIIEKVKSPSLNKDNVKVVSSLAENNKYKHFGVFHYIILIILVVYLIFALGLVNLLLSSRLFQSNKRHCSAVELDKKSFKTLDEDKDEKKALEKEVLLKAQTQTINNVVSDDLSSDDCKSAKIESCATTRNKEMTPEKESPKYINTLHKVSAVLFDFNKNFSSIFEKRKTEESDLKLFDGIRVIAAAWVILDHSFVTYSEMPQRNPETILEDYIRSFKWQFLFNSSFCVDVFFSMSGFLLTYITLRRREMLENASFGKIVMGILLRLLRIWPLLILLFLAYWKFFIYLLDGPYSGYIFNREIESCNIQWPFIMTLINNFTLGKFEGGVYPWCFSWGWYIPNDFQLSIVGIIFMLIYLKNRKQFYFSFAFLCLLCFAGEIYQFYKYKFGTNVFDLSEGGAEYMFVYFLLYVRCGPYFIGYLFGIFYAEYKEDEKHGRDSTNRKFFDTMKKSKFLYITSYIIGLLTMATIVFSVYFSYERDWSLAEKIIYNVLSRKGFVVGFFLVCLPIMQGNLQSLGGWLASDFFVPLSKISFAVYVIHSFVIRYIYYNFRHAIYFEISMLFLYATSFIIVVYFLSLFVTAIFEAPFMHLRSLLIENKIKKVKKVSESESVNKKDSKA
jgi:peptidoglycan/LPS O-acetylase OafA/YrhL